MGAQCSGRPRVAIGPVMPGWGSWEWVGADLASDLGERFDVVTFERDDVPQCDVAIVVKHPLAIERIEEVSRRAAVIYAPVDFYGSVVDVDGDHRMLRRCDRVVVHAERLRKCFAPYAPVEYVDHHLKFVTDEPQPYRDDGELLWVGVRTNVPHLGDWLRRNSLPGPLRVLTNLERPAEPPDFTALGLRDVEGVVVEHWTADVHRRRLGEARAAVDVKGFAFRRWHKPPAKALDFVASGVPLAMNGEASAVEHLRDRYGFEVAEPTGVERWLSYDYWEATRDVAERLRAELGIDRITSKWAAIVEDVLRGRELRRSVERPSPSEFEWEPTLAAVTEANDPVRVAVVSLLFEWPTKGGGNVHTYELVRALDRAGYEVRHLVVRSEAWGTGGLDERLPYDHELLDVPASEWSAATLGHRVRSAVEAYEPDAVILTDSWNAKPILADAVSNYPTILRLQALECVCPLNNVRLLPDLRQCDGNQLTDPERCRRCLIDHASTSGALHTAERQLCGVGSEAYDAILQRAFRDAHAVLVVNEETRRLVEPLNDRVIVAPSGFDPARFPWPWPDEEPDVERPATILFAGHPTEPIKGYGVLREACRRLWLRRHDFELVVTSDPLLDPEPFERFVGWQSQETLPTTLRAADVVVVPSIAQEALGRVAVEAQAVGRPVLASRIGGLPTTIAEGETGLLFEPGDPDDLARGLARLLDDPALRNRLGENGRRRFESTFTWDSLMEHVYRPLLEGCRGSNSVGSEAGR